jgi:ATP-dependent DNA helicase RecG
LAYEKPLPNSFSKAADSRVKVTFLRKNTENEQKSTQKGTQKSTLKGTLKSTLKGTKKKILEIMSNDSTVTIPQIAEQLNLHPRGIAKHIKQLQEQRFVQRIGGDNGGHWEVVENDTKQ